MVYNTEFVGFGLRPSSSILETRKHNVSETACFHHRVKERPNKIRRGETPTLFSPLPYLRIEISSL